MTFPSPTRAQVVAALHAHGVRFRLDIAHSPEGRPWQFGLRAIVDHHTAGTNSLEYVQNRKGTFPFCNALIDRDGLVHILSTQSVWGSGRGGPWPGVAGRDSLHLVAWQNEVEDLGVRQSFTDAQLESLGRVNASLVSLGVPLSNEVNHRDWTDGNPPVGGYPLPTAGRKSDTRYGGAFLRTNTAKYLLKPPPFPGHVIGWNSPFTAANRAIQRCLTKAGYPTRETGTYISPTDSTMRINIELYAKGHSYAVGLDRALGIKNPGAVGPNLYASLMTYYNR